MDRFHVPCCPTCHLPLVQAEGDDTKGTCLSLYCPDTVYDTGTWTWVHQSVFNGSELPPHDGWKPIRVVYDNGGVLLPGPTYARNDSGEAEEVS